MNTSIPKSCSSPHSALDLEIIIHNVLEKTVTPSAIVEKLFNLLQQRTYLSSSPETLHLYSYLMQIVLELQPQCYLTKLVVLLSFSRS